jgi:hypothetical protein
MIRILSALLKRGEPTPARQIFRSVVNQQIRLRIMRTLLEQTEQNRALDTAYDEVIDEFDSLNGLRNKFLHGLWWTHTESGRVFFAEPSLDEFSFLDQREVKKKELETTLRRMATLTRRIYLGTPLSSLPISHRPPSP